MLNINKISIISNEKPDILSALHVPQLEGPMCGFEVPTSPKQLLSPTIRSTLMINFQGCLHPTLSEKNAGSPSNALYSLFLASVFSPNCPGVHTHLPTLFCCQFPQSTTFGLLPVSALVLTQRPTLGSWAWPIRLSLRQAWDWERERLSQLAEGYGPLKSRQLESWVLYSGKTIWAISMYLDKENSLLGQLLYLRVLKPVHAQGWCYHCSW